MGGILDKLDEWLRGLLVEGITGNLSGMFDTVNTKVGEIAGEVGMTPQAWNGGVFSMIRSLSETVILPIAGVILTFVMCYELIQLVTEKNNLHDVDRDSHRIRTSPWVLPGLGSSSFHDQGCTRTVSCSRNGTDCNRQAYPGRTFPLAHPNLQSSLFFREAPEMKKERLLIPKMGANKRSM